MRKELIADGLQPGSELKNYDSLIEHIEDTTKPFISSNTAELISCFRRDGSLGVQAVTDLYLKGAHLTDTRIERDFKNVVPDVAQLLYSGSSTALLYGDGALAFFQDITPQMDFSAEQVFGDFIELDFVLDGDCSIELGGQKLAYKGLPRVRISNANIDRRQIRTYTKDSPVRNVSIWLRPEFLTNFFGINANRLTQKMQLVLQDRQIEPISFPLTHKISSVLEDIYNHPFHYTLAYHYLNAKVAELICLTIGMFKDNPELNIIEDGRLPSNKINSIASALRIINDNLSQPLNSSELADKVGMSRSNLSRSFKSLYGITPNEYQIRKRMETARRLLQEGNLSVQDVAWQVGYENQSSFGRVYKQHYQCAPTADKFRSS